MTGTVAAVCTSDRRGRKTVQKQIVLRSDHGIEGDVHAGPWHRQVSLLDEESIEQMRAKGLSLPDGAFGENIVTRGIDLMSIPEGGRIEVGSGVVLELTQHGKECHTRCSIYYQAGDCIMPRRGVFARVVQGGVIRPGDPLCYEHDVAVEVPERARSSSSLGEMRIL